MVANLFVRNAIEPAFWKSSCKSMFAVFSCTGLTNLQPGVTSEQVDNLGNKVLIDDAQAHGFWKSICIPVFNACKMMEVEMVSAQECFLQDLKASGMAYTIIRMIAFFRMWACISTWCVSCPCIFSATARIYSTRFTELA